MSAGPSRRNLMRERSPPRDTPEQEEEKEEASLTGKTETSHNHHDDVVEDTDVAIAAVTAAMDTDANANLVRALSTRSMRGGRRSMMQRTSSLRRPGSERGRRSCFANSSALDAFTTPPQKEVVRKQAKGNKPSLKNDLLDLDDDSDSDTDVRRAPNLQPRVAPRDRSRSPMRSFCGRPSKSERGSRTAGFSSAAAHKGHKPTAVDRNDPAADDTDSDSESGADTESSSSEGDNSSRRRHGEDDSSGRRHGEDDSSRRRRGILKKQHSTRLKKQHSARKEKSKAPAYCWESHLDDSKNSKHRRGHTRQARKVKSGEDFSIGITRSRSAGHLNPDSQLKKKPSRRKLMPRKVTRLDSDDDCSMDSSCEIVKRDHGKTSMRRSSSVGSKLGLGVRKSPDTKLRRKKSAQKLSEATSDDDCEKPMKRCASAGTLDGTGKSSKREARRTNRGARRPRRHLSNSSNSLDRQHLDQGTEKKKETTETCKALAQSASAGSLGLLVTSAIDKQKNEKARATAERFKAITKSSSAASLRMHLTTPVRENCDNQRWEMRKKEGISNSTSAGSLGLLIAAAAGRDKAALTPSNVSRVRQMTANPNEKISKHNKAFAITKKIDNFDKKFDQFLSNRSTPKLDDRVSQMKKTNAFANILAQSKDKSDMLSAWLVSPTET